MIQKHRTRVRDFSKTGLMKRVRQLEKDGWQVCGPYQVEKHQVGVNVYFFIMEREVEVPDTSIKKTRLELKQEREEFGFYLKNHRIAAGLTIRELCLRMEKAPSTYLAYETGKRLPRDMEAFMHDFKKALKEDL